jgi:hypothetical protein
LPIVKTVLIFLTALPDEAAPYLSARYAGLVVDLFRECEQARPNNGVGMMLMHNLFNFHKKLYAVASEPFWQQLSATVGRLPNGQELLQQYSELLQTDQRIPLDLLRRFYQALYEASVV